MATAPMGPEDGPDVVHCAVLGDPISHSLSPVLHRAGYAALGAAWAATWTYEAVQVPSGGLEAFLDGLDDTWRGLSLTMPLKREAIPLAASLSDRAKLAGAANTLVRAEGRWHGDNTDVPGAMDAIDERYDGPIERAVILGGGATATSTGIAVAGLGATSITVLVRDPERAAATLDVLRALPTGPAITVGSLDERPYADILVSTIPAPAQTEQLVESWANVPVLFDVVYDPWPTPLTAAASGVVVSGLDLLVHQAAHQFELFTGELAPVDAMRAAGEAALA